MAVFTSIKEAQLIELLNFYDLGKLDSYTGISEGIENSNYFVSTQDHHLVLTIFELLDAGQVNTVLKIQQQLQQQGLPLAAVIESKKGDLLLEYSGKPVALLERVAGQSVENPSKEHCKLIGEQLNRFHQCAKTLDASSVNQDCLSWMETSYDYLKPLIKTPDRSLIKAEMDFQILLDTSSLETGLVHGDLFPDNVLFHNNSVSAILDLYSCSNDVLLFDLAVCINAWCSKEDGTLDEEKANAMLGGYFSARKISVLEKSAFTILLRRAALRYFMSRLQDRYENRDGELVQWKDPDVYKRILQDRIQNQLQYKKLLS